MNTDGWRHLEAGRLQAAAAAADAALAADPEDGQALHLRGILAWRSGERGAAVECVSRAAGRFGDSEAAGAALRDLCEMHRVCGRLDEAVEAGRRAARLKPRDPDTHYNLGIVLQELG